jgi:hypothetical protein
MKMLLCADIVVIAVAANIITNELSRHILRWLFRQIVCQHAGCSQLLRD